MATVAGLGLEARSLAAGRGQGKPRRFPVRWRPGGAWREEDDMSQFSGRSMQIAAILILLLVPLLFFWDMVVLGHEPLAADTQAVKPLGRWATQAHEELGEVPLWCPGIFAGMPSYGSFIYTPSSPLNLVRNVRLAFGENRGARYYLSLVVGALALYFWMVWRRRHPLAALGGALIFVMTPYFLGLVAAGHSTKLHALYLAPAVFFALDAFLARRTLAIAILLAAAIAMQLWCNHPQISYYTLLLGALYTAGVLLFDRPATWRDRRLLGGLALGGLALAVAAALVLEPYAAVLEYTPHSIRGSTSVLAEGAGNGETGNDENAGGGDDGTDGGKARGTDRGEARGADGGEDGGGRGVDDGAGWDYATAWSYPPREIVCFLFPAVYGLEGQTYWGTLTFTQSTHYFGATVVVLAVAGLLLTRGRRRWIWLALAGITLLIGFGRHLPVLYGPMYHGLPMFNKFRVPSMIYAFLPLFGAVLAADGLQGLLELPLQRASSRKPRGTPAKSSAKQSTKSMGQASMKASWKKSAKSAQNASADASAKSAAKSAAKAPTKSAAKTPAKAVAKASGRVGANGAGTGATGSGAGSAPPGPKGLPQAWLGVTVVLGVLLVLWVLFGGAVADSLRGGGAFVHAREVSALGPHGDRIFEALRTRPMDQLLSSSPLPPGYAQLVMQRMELLRSSVTVGLALLFATALVIEARRRRWFGGLVAVTFLVGLVTADLWITDRKFYDPRPRSVSEAVLASDGIVRFLQAEPEPFRVAPVVQTPGSLHGFSSNRYAAFGLESIGGYQPAKLRIYDDLIQSGATFSPAVLSMLGARYVIAGADLTEAGLPVVYEEPAGEGRSIYVHRNPAALPRAFFVTRLERTAGGRAMLEALQTADFDPSVMALVPRKAYPALPDRYAPGVVERGEFGLHEQRMRVSVEGPETGLLVMSEIFYEPGWQARIDGAEAPLLRVNHVLRALEVPPGEHEVVVRAVSPAYRAGLWVSRMTGGACILLLLGLLWRSRLGRQRGVEGD